MVPIEKKKDKKRKSEEDESKQKQTKKSKNTKVFGKGISDISTYGISISGVGTTLLSSTSQPTKLSPIPLNSAPSLEQPQHYSKVTLSDQSLTKSVDSRDSDPKSPPTHTLPQTHTDPSQSQTTNSLSYDFQGPSTPYEESSSGQASPDFSDVQSSPPHPVIDHLSAITFSFT